MTMQRLHPFSAATRVIPAALNGFFLPTILALVAGRPILDILGVQGVDPRTLALVLGPLGLALGATYGYLTYRRFAYELTPDTFDVASGVVGRTEREIPIRRIQNVDVQQNVIHQLFDVAVVGIETAGGGATEATLSVVGIDEARRLQRGIRERRARLQTGNGERTDRGQAADVEGTGTDATGDRTPTDARDTPGVDVSRGDVPEVDVSQGDVPEVDVSKGDLAADDGDATPTAGVEDAETAERVASTTDRETTGADWSDDEWQSDEPFERLLALRPVDLLVLAATNFQLGSLVFVLFGVPFAGEFAADFLVGVAEPFGGPERIDPAVMTPDQYLVLGGVAGPIVLVGGYILSAALAVLEYYGFELGRRGNDLVYERGLLQRYSGSIPTDKIQTLTLRETAPMRWLGFAALDVETAGGAGGSGSGGGTQAAVPIAERDRVVSLAHDLFEFADIDVERPPKRARQRYAVRYSLVVLAVLALAYGVSTNYESFTLWYLPALAFLAVPPAAHLKWAHRGYALTDDHVVVRTGFWRRRTAVVPYYRLQTVVGEATVFQRRRDLASLVADTASSATLSRSSPTAHDLDVDTVRGLQRELRDRLQAHLRDA